MGSVTVILDGLVTFVNVTIEEQSRKLVEHQKAFVTTLETAPAESVNVLKDTVGTSVNVMIRIVGATTGCFVGDHIVVGVTAGSVCVTPITWERPVNV